MCKITVQHDEADVLSPVDAASVNQRNANKNAVPYAYHTDFFALN